MGCRSGLHVSSKRLRLLQIPRLYDIYKAQGLVDNFEQLLDNIFTPLFEVTIDPNTHPQLHLFLKTVRPRPLSIAFLLWRSLNNPPSIRHSTQSFRTSVYSHQHTRSLSSLVMVQGLRSLRDPLSRDGKARTQLLSSGMMVQRLRRF